MSTSKWFSCLTGSLIIDPVVIYKEHSIPQLKIQQNVTYGQGTFKIITHPCLRQRCEPVWAFFYRNWVEILVKNYDDSTWFAYRKTAPSPFHSVYALEILLLQNSSSKCPISSCSLLTSFKWFVLKQPLKPTKFLSKFCQECM